MSGEFVTINEAQLITSRATVGSNAFIVDILNLQQYITGTKADQVLIQPGINGDGTETLVITCYKAGNPVYHTDGSGNQCVLEHITLPPVILPPAM